MKQYTITIQVLDEETGTIIGKRSTSSIPTLKLIVEDVEGWIEKYDKENKIQCLKCNRYFDEGEMESVPDGDNEEKICEECLAGLLYNHDQLNEMSN